MAETVKVKRPRGRPRNVEGESFALGGEMLKSRLDPRIGGVYFMPIDEIIVRKGWRTYREMRHDEQVKAALAFKKTLVGGRDYQIKPANDTAEAKAIAKFVQDNLKRFNFEDVIHQSMTAFDFGFSVGEILWEPATYEGSTKYMIANIKHRDPESIEIKMDERGNILGFRQTQIGKLEELDRQYCWHWAHQSEFGNAYGMSDLRAAYRSWWAKKFIINFWHVFLERMGSPMTMMKYPQGASDTLKATLKQIMRGLSAKTEILVPEGVAVDLVEAKRAGQGTHSDAIKYCDMAIARALLMVGIFGISVESTGRGADSESRLHLQVLFKTCDRFSKQIAFTFARDVIKPLVDMNYQHDNLYPSFEWQSYGAFQAIELSDAIRQLHLAGVIDVDQEDVNYVRSILGLPLRLDGGKDDEVMRPAEIPPVGGGTGDKGAAGQQGNDSAKKGAASKKTGDDGQSK